MTALQYRTSLEIHFVLTYAWVQTPGPSGGTPSSAQPGRYKENRTSRKTNSHSHNTCEQQLMITELLPFTISFPSFTISTLHSITCLLPSHSKSSPVSVVNHIRHTWIHCAYIKCGVLHNFQNNSYTLPAPQHLFASCHCSTVQLLFTANW